MKPELREVPYLYTSKPTGKSIYLFIYIYLSSYLLSEVNRLFLDPLCHISDQSAGIHFRKVRQVSPIQYNIPIEL